MFIYKMGMLLSVGCGLQNYGGARYETGDTGLMLETVVNTGSTTSSSTTGTGIIDTSTHSTTQTNTNTTPSSSAPTVSDFYLNEGTGSVLLYFVASDVDGDLVGGSLNLSINGSSQSFAISSDIDNFNEGGTSWVTIATFSDCNRGETYIVTGSISDAAGNSVSGLSDNITVSGFGADVAELGDTQVLANNLGVLTSTPAYICGDLYSTGNSGGYYIGDYDYNKFRPSSSGSATMRLTWDAGSGDYDLHLTNSGGTVLLSAIQDGTMQPEQITYTLSSSQDYYLVVIGWSGPASNWQVEIQ